jgi:hypothetical protein
MEKPLISTSLGGMHDWINRRFYQQLDRYKLVGVSNMDYVPWYTSDQKWADPDLEQLKEKMRWVYENYDRAKGMTLKAKNEIVNKLSYEAVGDLMRQRIEDIYDNELIQLYAPKA